MELYLECTRQIVNGKFREWNAGDQYNAKIGNNILSIEFGLRIYFHKLFYHRLSINSKF